MLFEGVVLSVIIGYIRKGRLKNFENVRIKLWYLISAAFLIQKIAVHVTQINDTWFYVMHLLSYVIIMFVCVINRDKLSIALMGIGTLMNFIPISFNDGMMPVKVPEYIIDPMFDRGHMLMTDDTLMKVFGDLFLVRIPGISTRVFSIGDFFLVLGAFMLVQYGMMPVKNAIEGNNRKGNEMKTYMKPVLIGVLGVVLFAAGVIFVMSMYNKYLETIRVGDEPEFVETQIDFTSIYPDADADQLATVYDGSLIVDTNPVRYIGGNLYFPVDFVIGYLNDQFFYDSAENTLTYTTDEDIIRLKKDELTYTVNDVPLKLDIGMTEFDGIAYLPLSLVQKFTHHDFIFNEAYHVLVVDDWYASTSTGEVYFEEGEVYVRMLPEDQSPYIHRAFVGMEVHIVGEEKDYYQVLTKEGFLGYVKMDSVRSVVTLHSNMEPLPSRTQLPGNDFDGKLNLVWHHVWSMNKNQEVKERFSNVKEVDVISPTWFTLKGTDGDVTSLADLDYVRWAHDQGYQVWALISNLGDGYTRSMTHEVLSSTKKRAEVIRKLISYASLYELDGINIDLEAIPEADGPYYIQFCKELSVYCEQEGLIVSADLPVVKSWTRHYGRDELADYLDYIMVMGYDEHWGTSPVAGSVASITWTEEGIADTLKEVPREKLIIGIPFYTRLWKEEEVDGEVKVTSKAYGMEYARQIMDDKDVELEWLEDIGQYYGEYEEDGFTYKMWLEDLTSVEERMKIAASYDVGGVAAWKIGFENDGVWDIISDYMKP